jgi:hypothetical protein
MSMKALGGLKLSSEVSVERLVLRRGGFALRRANGAKLTIAKSIVVGAKPTLGRGGGSFVSRLGQPTGQ